MKVKLSRKSVVFKISEDELKVLQAQDPVTEIIDFGSERLDFVLSPVIKQEKASDDQLYINFDKQNGVITLFVRLDALRSLSEMGRSKEGVVHDGDVVQLSLQVDLKKDSRPRKSI